MKTYQTIARQIICRLTEIPSIRLSIFDMDEIKRDSYRRREEARLDVYRVGVREWMLEVYRKGGAIGKATIESLMSETECTFDSICTWSNAIAFGKVDVNKMVEVSDEIASY